MKVIRVSTAGNVDDGKSTLIGRLLFDTGSLKDDHLQNLKGVSQKMGFNSLHLALVTDGLKAEREQGITIDVAYRYFETKKCKFILADTPGHEEFTRNMVTGTSNSDVSLVLLDATRDESEQTKRHIMISHLLGVKDVVICVNKMDLIEFKQETYQLICSKLNPLIEFLGDGTRFHFIPVCALNGDNIATQSKNMPWYTGSSVLEFLENIELQNKENTPARFVVQMTLMPPNSASAHNRRYAGMLLGSNLKINDQVVLYPTRNISSIKSIYNYQKKIDIAHPGMPISLEVEGEHPISRGSWIIKVNNPIKFSKMYQVKLCALQPRGLKTRKKYIARITSQEVECVIELFSSKINFKSLKWDQIENEISVNEIANGILKFSSEVMADSYQDSRQTGSMILIDPLDNQTVAAVMIIS